MRQIAIALLVTLLCASPTFAQHPYDLDPYKPSDAALLRNYGAVLVGLTPILELRKLDPFVPSHASLLRQLGGALPLWVGWYSPVPVPVSAPVAPLTPFTGTPSTLRPASNVVVIIVPPRNTQSPAGQDRGVAPLPVTPRRTAPRLQVAENGGPAKIQVSCDSVECRWSIRDREPGSDVDRNTCGWMPKGGTFESGGPLPCEDESVGP
jgi:hypothetical protein